MIRNTVGFVFLLNVAKISAYVSSIKVFGRLEKHGVVPDVISEVALPAFLRVKYGSRELDLGNEFTPTQTKDPPKVAWNRVLTSFYTLCMIDPDVPSRKNPEEREWLHWLIVNIPAMEVDKGQILAEYIGAAPQAGTGPHRYVFLLYKQRNKANFSEPYINNTCTKCRPNFKISEFAMQYKFGQPVAVNFFYSSYDDYVPILNKQLGR